jgi:multicomponent Na+:H+ antiporter subunit E
MRPFVWNLVLALLWVALTGVFSAGSFAAGFAIGYLVLVVAGRTLGVHGYASHGFRVMAFLLFYLKEVLVSNLRVARDILRPRMRTRPAVVAIPLDPLSPAQITLLANLITMTPGTLSLDVSDDRSTLYVHAMFMSDARALRREIKHGLERRVKGVLR